MKSKKIFIILFCCSLALLIGCNKRIKNTELVHIKDSTICVSILPLHEIEQEQVDLVANELEKFYNVKTIILNKGELPDSCKNPYKKRYNANKILDYLFKIKGNNTNYILALTNKGIATKKEQYNEWGILGLGHRPGPCCVVSTANMGKNIILQNERLVKVCLHEMGHNFGLPHCESGDSKCLMRNAKGTVKTVDDEEKYLCKYCSLYLINKGLKLPSSI